MKKIILTMAFVFASGIALINANQSDKTKELVEEYGCASDCVQTSKLQVLEFTNDWNNDQLLVDNYMILYTNCA